MCVAGDNCSSETGIEVIKGLKEMGFWSSKNMRLESFSRAEAWVRTVTRRTVHPRILPYALLLSYIMVCPAPLTVGHPFEDAHQRISQALCRHPWCRRCRVLGQRLYANSLRDVTPSQCLTTTFWRYTSHPPSQSGIPE
jgi:hypothetical protein